MQSEYISLNSPVQNETAETSPMQSETVTLTSPMQIETVSLTSPVRS